MNRCNIFDAQKFLNSIFENCKKGQVEFRFLPSKKQIFINLDQLLQYRCFLSDQNIFFGVATRNGGGGKDCIVEIPALWIDVDIKELSMEKILLKLDEFLLKPSAIVYSGGGIHAYWFLKEPAYRDEIPEVENILKRLSFYFGADMAATDASRILRIPGTFNLKYNPPRLTILDKLDSSLTYNLIDFDFLPEAEQVEKANKTCEFQDDWQNHLLMGVPEGMRNQTAARLAGRYFAKGLNEEEVLVALEGWNRRNPEPLPEKELKSVVKSISKTHMRDHINEKIIQDKSQMVISADFPGLVDFVIDDNGDVAFLIKENSSLRVTNIFETKDKVIKPPDQIHLPFKLPRATNVFEYFKSDDDKQLFKDIVSYFKRFSSIPDELWNILTCKVFLTYIQDHPDIYYLPELLFWAEPEHGKSRTGKAAVYVSYRGIHLVDLREANLFRYSQNLKATLFFDIKDLWKKVVQNKCEDILLSRHEKGAKVGRVLHPERGPFKDMTYFDVYGPTILATNEPVHKILNTRCITISMPYKLGKYEKPLPEKAQELKERLTAWRARVMDKPLPEIEPIQGLNGRLWDISEPLLRVCKMVYPDAMRNLINALLIIAGERLEDKKESIEGEILTILHELSPENVPEWSIKTSKLLEKLNEDRPEGHKHTPQYLGIKLKAMGIKTRRVHGYSEILLNRTEFKSLTTEFGVENNLQYSPETLPNSTTLKNAEKSIICLGRELEESFENSTQTLPEKIIENKGDLSLVESGRELFEVSEKNLVNDEDNYLDIAIED